VDPGAGVSERYSVDLYIDAVAEPEDFTAADGGAFTGRNDTIASATDIEPHIKPLPGGKGDRVAVRGRIDTLAEGREQDQPDDGIGSAIPAWVSFMGFLSHATYGVAFDGSLDAPGDRDWYDLGKLPGASLFSLSATGAATGVAATEAGAAGDRALPSNLHVDLYQSNAGSPVLLTSSTDGLIENFTLPAPDSYFAVVTADPSTAGVGAYHFGALLDAARPAPAGASAPAEQEPNDDAASATPIGGRWRDMVYSADRAFDLEWFDYEALGDIDYAEYRFTQGDLLSVAFQQYDGATLSGVRIALRDDQDHAVASFDGTAFDPAVTRGGMYGIVIPQTGRYFLSMQSIASSGERSTPT